MFLPDTCLEVIESPKDIEMQGDVWGTLQQGNMVLVHEDHFDSIFPEHRDLDVFSCQIIGQTFTSTYNISNRRNSEDS